MHTLSRHIFDRVVIINLDRRTDRLSRVIKNLGSCQWPFQDPVRFSAVDATKFKLPPFWYAGRGAFGCMRSHQRVLEEAIMDGVESLLVLEDDVVFRDDFGPQVLKFLGDVPGDWDQLMIGGQLMNNSMREIVVPGVMKVSNCQRTHCFAVRGQYMKELYAKWCGSYGHCDHVMGPFQNGYNIYAPDPFLAGQTEGQSDINGANNPAKFWNAPIKNAPIFWVKCPKGMLKEMWRASLHGGRNRNELGVDVGLAKIIDGKEGFMAKAEKLNDWISMIEWEGRSMTPESFCFIWHPDLDADMFQEIVGDRLVAIESDDFDEIREKVLVAVRAAKASLENSNES